MLTEMMAFVAVLVQSDGAGSMVVVLADAIAHMYVTNT
jgi:hypothetical protein